MASFVAVFDACVLYPASVRDLLLRLALTDLFRARWTDRIHDEWISAVLKQRQDLSKAQLERTRELMNQAVPDCLVTTYESLIDGVGSAAGSEGSTRPGCCHSVPGWGHRHLQPQALSGRSSRALRD